MLRGEPPAWADVAGYWVSLRAEGGVTHVYLTPEGKAAKPAAGSGEHWVTIRGTHVLVDGNGTPVDAAMRERLAGREAITAPSADAGLGMTREGVKQAVNENAPLMAYMAGVAQDSPAAKAVTSGTVSQQDAAFELNTLAQEADLVKGRVEAVWAAQAERAGLTPAQAADVAASYKVWNDYGASHMDAATLVEAAAAEFGLGDPPAFLASHRAAMLERRRKRAEAVLSYSDRDEGVVSDFGSSSVSVTDKPYIFRDRAGIERIRTKRLQEIVDGRAATFAPDQAALQRGLRAMYEDTQADLAKLPGDTVTLYRGVRSVGAFAGQRMRLGESSLPVSSWSANPYTGLEFGVLTLKAEVPKSRILATYRTGLGTGREMEMLVLSSPDDEALVWQSSLK